MDLVIFEENKPFVLEALGNGNFDYMESASEVFETEFFRHIKAKTILDKFSDTYQQLLPSDSHVSVYYQNYYALFKPFETVGFVVTLHEEARNKIAHKCRRIRRELDGVMRNPRPP
jgi:ERCC4-type nuclease